MLGLAVAAQPLIKAAPGGGGPFTRFPSGQVEFSGQLQRLPNQGKTAGNPLSLPGGLLQVSAPHPEGGLCACCQLAGVHAL
ncbi:hypothetical protein D3C84_835850 [compost metagenome]